MINSNISIILQINSNPGNKVLSFSICNYYSLSDKLLESCEIPNQQRIRHVVKHPATLFFNRLLTYNSI